MVLSWIMEGSNKDGSLDFPNKAPQVRSVSRRKLLKTTGAGLTVSSFAGCLSGQRADDSIFFGTTLPLSGPFSAVGQNIQQAVELAVSHTNEQGDAGESEVSVKFADTKTDPSTGQQRAREFIQDGADFLAGSFSNSVALSIGELASREELLYVNLGGGNSTTGEDCRSNVFVSATNAAQQASGSLGYVLTEGLGDSVYTISSDYSWGQDHKEWDEQYLAPEYGAEFLGNTWTEIGQSDFGQALAEARNSGADIIMFNQAAGDHVNSANQAHEFNMFDDFVCVWPATGITEAAAIGQDIISHENFYAGAVWYWEHETEESQAFVDAYSKEYDERPYGFSACMYVGVRSVLAAIGDSGTTEKRRLRQELEGSELFPQLWGVNEQFRACDHASTIPTMTVTGKEQSEFNKEEQNHFEILDFPENVEEEQMRACEQTGCEM